MQVPSLFCFALVFFPFARATFPLECHFWQTHRNSTCCQNFSLLPCPPHECVYSSWSHSFPATICLFNVFLLLDPVSLGNNKVSVYIFRCFHLFLGTILKKIFICAFEKGCELRAHTRFNGVKVRNGTGRMTKFCLSFFSYFIHLVPEMQELVSPCREVTSEKYNDAFGILPYKEFCLKTASVSCFSSWRKDLSAHNNAMWH